MRRTLAIILALLGLGLLGTACSGTSKQLEDKVADVVQSDLKVSDIKVTCPKDVKAKKGEKVTCTATGDFDSVISSAYSLDSSQSVNIDNLKIDVEFVEDDKFSANYDTADVESQLSDQLLGGGSSSASSDASLPDGGEDAPTVSS